MIERVAWHCFCQGAELLVTLSSPGVPYPAALLALDKRDATAFQKLPFHYIEIAHFLFTRGTDESLAAGVFGDKLARVRRLGCGADSSDPGTRSRLRLPPSASPLRPRRSRIWWRRCRRRACPRSRPG